MTLTLLPDPRDWLRPENTRRAEDHLLEIAREHDDASLEDLAEDALATLKRCRHITFRYGRRKIETDCEYAGRYRWDPPVIEVSESRSRARDAFTALHEYGHHLQKNDTTWALDVLGELPEFDRKRLEETIANGIAARMLIPDTLVDELFTGTLTAAFLSELHSRSAASRHAIIRRAVGLAADPTLLIVSDYSGDVVAAVSSDPDRLYAPAVGLHQPDLARLAGTVRGPGAVRGRTESGVQYRSGNSRSDFSVELAADRDGLHFFSVVTPTYRFGSQQWDEELVECANEACGITFMATPMNRHDPCGGHKCPACHACGCDRRAMPVCPHCTLELSAADLAAGRLEHEAC
jgi:Zn-dependent peptidase ImmA (M78 family)